MLTNVLIIIIILVLKDLDIEPMLKVQRVGLLCVVSALQHSMTFTWALIHVLAISVPIQPPVNGLAKTRADGPNAWNPATHMGNSDKLLAPSSPWPISDCYSCLGS